MIPFLETWNWTLTGCRSGDCVILAVPGIQKTLAAAPLFLPPTSHSRFRSCSQHHPQPHQNTRKLSAVFSEVLESVHTLLSALKTPCRPPRRVLARVFTSCAQHLEDAALATNTILEFFKATVDPFSRSVNFHNCMSHLPACHPPCSYLRVFQTATMTNITDGITADAKTNMIINLQIEIEARIEKLRAQCEAQCTSMRSRLERRVNRVPMVTRQTALVDLLKASAPKQPVIAPAPAEKTTTAAPTTTVKTNTATTKAAGTTTNTAGRKTRTAAPSNASASSRPTSSHTSSQEERVKSTTKTTKLTPAYAKPTQTARAKKRSSNDLSGEDKENSELPVPKKRTRTVAQKPAAEKPEKVEKGEKPAAVGSTRSTRAGSRTKPAAGQVLSPKNNAANARKPAARSVRPR